MIAPVRSIRDIAAAPLPGDTVTFPKTGSARVVAVVRDLGVVLYRASGQQLWMTLAEWSAWLVPELPPPPAPAPARAAPRRFTCEGCGAEGAEPDKPRCPACGETRRLVIWSPS